MQKRQLNRRQYFHELAKTSEKYFIPYVQQYRQVSKGMNVLEIGCGDGGNLLPFSRMNCNVVGIDLSEERIRDARVFFEENKAKGRFIASDIFQIEEFQQQFDIIVCHDVIEHINDKESFLRKCKQLLKQGGGGFSFLFLRGRCHLGDISKYVEVDSYHICLFSTCSPLHGIRGY